MFLTNRQHDEANEQAIADGERRYAASFEEEELNDWWNSELASQDDYYEPAFATTRPTAKVKGEEK
jgi:hypothetical protein